MLWSNNPNFAGTTAGSELLVTNGLGAMLNRSMKTSTSTQCVAAVKKAKSMLGVNRREMENNISSIINAPMQIYSVGTLGILCTVLVATLPKKYCRAEKDVKSTNIIREL